MVSIRTVGVLFSALALMVACDPEPATDGPVAVEEKTLQTRGCGREGDHMIVSFTSNIADSCGDEITINGQKVKGLRSYNAQDHRWSLGINLPEGVTSGELRVQCGEEDIKLGALTVPCATTDVPGNHFAVLSGDVKIEGCDDADGFVRLHDFTPDSFQMDDLGSNLTVTFTVDGTRATAENVAMYGKYGHTVTLRITDGIIHLHATHPEGGSCDATLRKPTAGRPE